jgi:nucleoside phosphorylase
MEAPQMTGSTSDVSIGIVTALPIEYAAMRLLLDEGREEALPGDSPYLVGSLPGRGGRTHGVALAMLAHDGTRSAAAVTTALLVRFPQIRCVVMVGIAGGVPAADAPQRHVRLGDIVVATDLVDYGHLRSVDGRRIIRHGIDRPSADLVNADRALQADEVAGARPWESWLGAGAAVPAAFARPGGDSDVLLVDGVRTPHPDDSGHGRQPGLPRVHRGAVGSADQLVRDEALRDELARDYGVYAIEMEGAGIAAACALRSVQWFMVRGIADYCLNATKGDEWHPYASLAAAAYTRALLRRCPVTAAPPVPVPVGDTAQLVPLVEIGRLSDRPAQPNGTLFHLQMIVDALLEVAEVRDPPSRRMLVELLPRNIQTAIHDGGSARLHVISIVRTCLAFREGQTALLEALRATAADGSVDRERAEIVILRHWPWLTTGG